MNPVKAVIAIDIGTSSARAGLVDQELRVHSIASRPYRLNTPHPGYAEQDPDEIFTAMSAAVREVLGECGDDLEVVGLCLDTAMHSLLALDRTQRASTPVITWADMRAARIASRLANGKETAAALYRATGCPVHAMYFPAKAVWLAENQPTIFEEAATFTSIKGYLLGRLTGRYVDDLAIASGYGLLNIADLTWDEKALHQSGLSPKRLPELVEPRTVVGTLTPELAQEWDSGRLPVVAGGSDGPLANVGAGCVQEGDMAITVGTSSAVRMFTSAPRADDGQRTWCYYLGDTTWVVGGAINGGASSLAWLREAFPGITQAEGAAAHEELDRLAASVPPGSEGLLFAPYLAGERNPGLQGEARGYLAGLSLHHSAKHFVRATMEGIAYQIAWVYLSVAEVAGRPQKIRVTGGFVGSSVWPQILADVLGRSLEVPVEKEGSLIGCAAFGLTALAPELDWRSLVAQIPVERTIQPNLDNHQKYQRHLEAYQRLYGAVRPHFSEILSLQDS